MNTILRRLRGAVSSALFWGAAWFGIGLTIHTVTRIFTGGRFIWPYELFNAVYMAGFMGLSGAMVGAGFAVFISANFRDQRVEELSPWRFAFGGGLVTALFTLVLLLSLGSWIWPFDLPVVLYSMGGLKRSTQHPGVCSESFARR